MNNPEFEVDEDGRVVAPTYLNDFLKGICGRWVPDPYAQVPPSQEGGSELSEAIHALRILAGLVVRQRDLVRSALEDLIFFEQDGSEDTMASVIDRLELTQFVNVVIDDGSAPS